MIAVLVLSVGLLGLAGLQMHGMRQTQSSGSLTMAAPLAEEMVERMRANLAGVDANRYFNVSLTGKPCGAEETTCPADDYSRTCYGSTCSESDLATSDIESWHFKVCNLMPCGTTATVTCIDSDDGATGEDADDCTDGSRHHVEIVWNDAASKSVSGVLTSSAETKRHLLVFQPINPVQ